MTTELDNMKRLLSGHDVATEDLVYVLKSEVREKNELLNIKLFNEWRYEAMTARATTKHRLIFKNVELRNVDLTGVDLRYCDFYDCDFNTCDFTMSDFWQCNFTNVTFGLCTHDSSNFHGSTFNNCKFDMAIFNSSCTFAETRFFNSMLSIQTLKYGCLDFKYSFVEGSVISTIAITSGGGVTIINPYGLDQNSNTNNRIFVESIDLTASVIINSRLINVNAYKICAMDASWSNLDIIDCNALKLQIHNLMLDNVRVDPSFFEHLFLKIRENIHYIDENRFITKKTKKLVRTIRDNFKRIGNSDGTSTYSVLLNDVDKTLSFNQVFQHNALLVKITHLFNYLKQTVFKILFNYCEAPFRIFGWLIAIVIGVGVLSWKFQLSDATSLHDNIYLSAITFATVGYGDVAPTDTFFSRCVFGSEGLIGVFLMSMFVVALTKKMTD